MKRFSIKKIFKALEMNRIVYYGWLNDGPSVRTLQNNDLKEQIRTVHERSRKTYSSPRIAHEFRKQGISVSRPRVARLMKAAGIRSCVGKRYRICTTDSNHGFHIVANLLNRNFSMDAIVKAWVSDITYVRSPSYRSLP